MSSKLRNALLIYLAINCIYMLPCDIWFYLSRGDPVYVPKSVLSIYVVSMAYFYIFRLTYVHIFLSVAFIPLSVWQFKRDKKIILFIISLLIIVVDIIVNIYWEKTGQWLARQ